MYNVIEVYITKILERRILKPMDFNKLSDTLKVISDPNRLMILEMLSCGELCAYDILEYFNFSQPTLSYHMKLLVNENLVEKSKLGRKIFYKLNAEKVSNLDSSLHQIFRKDKETCICDSLITKSVGKKLNE